MLESIPHCGDINAAGLIQSIPLDCLPLQSSLNCAAWSSGGHLNTMTLWAAIAYSLIVVMVFPIAIAVCHGPPRLDHQSRGGHQALFPRQISIGT
jgi:hypothetical protein